MGSAADQYGRQTAAESPQQRQRLVSAGGLQWHVEEIGQGPCVLLVHGTGASTHSFAPLAPLLAQSCHVVMVDLPGHGLTSAPSRSHLTIEGMARALAALLDTLGLEPEFCVGHSAGAVVLLQMGLDHACQAATIVSLNGALLPFAGFTSHLFGHFARLLAVAPLVPGLVSRRLGNGQSVDRLVGQLGSSIPPQQAQGYVRLLQSRKHISAALGMMANWDLKAFAARLPELEIALDLVVCDNDRAVPAWQAQQVHERLPGSRLHRLAGLGHLGHEEDPERVYALLARIAGDRGVDI
jgi:magnesium chelatase accessory protein